jgi:hypothetical protein
MAIANQKFVVDDGNLTMQTRNRGVVDKKVAIRTAPDAVDTKLQVKYPVVKPFGFQD